jgi:hypothetical protein
VAVAPLGRPPELEEEEVAAREPLEATGDSERTIRRTPPTAVVVAVELEEAHLLMGSSLIP